MSRSFRFTVPDQIGNEIDQYIYAKYGVIPAKAIPGMVLAMMSKNPLTDVQTARIITRYQDKAMVPSKSLSGTADGNTSGGRDA